MAGNYQSRNVSGAHSIAEEEEEVVTQLKCFPADKCDIIFNVKLTIRDLKCVKTEISWNTIFVTAPTCAI